MSTSLMRIAYPIYMIPWGEIPGFGIGRYMHELARGLLDYGPGLGAELLVYQDAYTSPGPFRHMPLRYCPSLRDRLGFSADSTRAWADQQSRQKRAVGDDGLPSRKARLLASWRNVRRNRFLQSEAIDVIHYGFHIGMPPLPGTVPVVATVHDLVPHLYPETAKAEVLWGWRQFLSVLDRVDHFVAPSESTARGMEEHMGVGRERISVIYEGVDPRFQPLHDRRASLELLEEHYGIREPFVLHVSTVEPRKNQIAVVRAMPHLAEPLRLVLAGGKGWRSEPLQREIDTLGLQERVLLPGFVADEHLPHLYGCAEAFVYPSLYEGFGLPLLEAMACETPVVSSSAGSLPEVCGDAAIYAPPTEPRAWAEALQIAVYNHDRRDELIRLGVARARSFRWQQAVEETVAMYREVIARFDPRRVGYSRSRHQRACASS
jgi:glycosyltransferase involved in cell wall biosynthesis